MPPIGSFGNGGCIVDYGTFWSMANLYPIARDYIAYELRSAVCAGARAFVTQGCVLLA